VAAIDLITALGRLLRDGSLRDALAADPQAVAVQLGVRECDHLAVVQLVPDDLEFQARVLLRKRLDAVHHILPETFRQLDGNAWPAFQQYARTNWPAGDDSIALDAYEFCNHLKQCSPESFCTAEWNRLQFALSKKRLGLRWIHRSVTAKNSIPALQVFIRITSIRWHEMLLFCRL
jgi:hypothetical protein